MVMTPVGPLVKLSSPRKARRLGSIGIADPQRPAIDHAVVAGAEIAVAARLEPAAIVEIVLSVIEIDEADGGAEIGDPQRTAAIGIDDLAARSTPAACRDSRWSRSGRGQPDSEAIAARSRAGRDGDPGRAETATGHRGRWRHRRSSSRRRRSPPPRPPPPDRSPRPGSRPRPAIEGDVAAAVDGGIDTRRGDAGGETARTAMLPSPPFPL